jgi:hypothetical protein
MHILTLPARCVACTVLTLLTRKNYKLAKNHQPIISVSTTPVSHEAITLIDTTTTTPANLQPVSK